MISPIGTYTYTIDAYLSDFRGKATLPMLGGFMLQAATKHAEERGFGYSSMVSMDRVWVLTRMNIQLSSYPTNDTDIKVHTWVSDVNKLFTERCFAFEDHEGNYFGYARSLWASIDIRTRRATNVLELKGLTDFKSDKDCPIQPATKLSIPKDLVWATSFVVKYSDIDINKHLNSMKYIEHFVDIFSLDLYLKKEIRGFEINYISEGHYGSQIDILKSEIQKDLFFLEMKNEDKTICSARVTWM